MKVNDRVIYFRPRPGGWCRPPIKEEAVIIELTRTQARVMFGNGRKRLVERENLEAVK